MNNRKSLPILLTLIFLLISSFALLGYYISKDRLNKRNQEIMLNEVKNSVMDRNYKKAYSITKLLKDKYPKNIDIAMLENTLAELANNNPFESKNLQRDTANQILDKIQGREKLIPINNENSDIAFNNRYIKDNTAIENYADRKEENSIEDEDILEFRKSKVPKNLVSNKSKIKDNKKSKIINKEFTERKKNLFNLKKLKDNLSKELNNTKNKQIDNQKKEIKKNENELREKFVNNYKTEQKNQIDERHKKNIKSLSLKQPIKIEETNIKILPKSNNQMIEKIARPYNYLIKKELYEILDNINTGNPSIGKIRLNELIKKGLNNKFKKVNDLIDKSKYQEAAKILLKLIKQNFELKPVGLQKAPLNKELFVKDRPVQKIFDKKNISSDNKIKEQDRSKIPTKHAKDLSKNLNSLKMLALINEKKGNLKITEEIYGKIASITKQAEDYYKVGIIKFKLQKYKEAIKAFDEAIAIHPNLKKAYTNKGTILIVLNKPKEAIKAFDKAIAIDQNYDTAFYRKGIAEEQNNNKAHAFLSFKKAHDIAKNPNYAIKAGITANHIGDFKSGEKYLEMASFSFKEKNDIILYNLAIAKFENDNLNDSLKIINKAISIRPEKPEYLYLKASIFLTKGDYHKAIEFYNNVILKTPKNITAHINLAKAYEKLGNESKAIEILEKVINQNHSVVLNNLGKLYKKQGNYQKAIDIFQKAEASSNLEAKYNLAITFLDTKENKKAMEKLIEYIKIDSNNPEALHALGIIEYNENGDNKRLKEIIKKFPNYTQNKNIIKIIEQ
ncbi:tetratricopeptide repeat protein [Borrelia sp. A-FGy1]|uniref:tetratricopeptide repeat protein n=1 Tax=Borrelia sp. A-FGy1 TaxID=2608247 RepID=UPI0015F6F121|nr:tetratricopeptide repeat protein [Borrelia sp. A-FGy1]QMU99013.1 tetratricopeptide repeat protein [Borrelia sp. A-FGy1]